MDGTEKAFCIVSACVALCLIVGIGECRAYNSNLENKRAEVFTACVKAGNKPHECKDLKF